MSRFQHGDRITCVISGEEITDAKISINRNGNVYICHNRATKSGSQPSNKLGYSYGWYLGEGRSLRADFESNNYEGVTNIRHKARNPRTKTARIAALRELKKSIVGSIDAQIKELQTS
jgi:hypothetical protein